MAQKLSDYVPAMKYGAQLDVTVDLTDILDNNGNEVIEIDGVASAVNYLRVTNAVAANPVILSAQGTADRGFEFHNDQAEEILILTPVASAVNQLTVTNAATGNPVLLSNDGEDDVGFEFHAKNGEEILKLEATAAATTFVSIKSQSTGNNPEISAEGEADLGITLMNDQGEELAIFNCNATAVNELTFANAAASSHPSIAASGGDTNVNIELVPKGSGQVDVQGGLLTSETTTSSGAGAVAVTGAIHEITTTGADALTLADGTEGQHLFCVMASDGGDGTLTPTNFANGSTITFNDVGDSCHLLFTNGSWHLMGSQGIAVA